MYVTYTPTVENHTLVTCRVLLAIVAFRALMVYLDQRYVYPVKTDILVGAFAKDAIVQNGYLALAHVGSGSRKELDIDIRPNARSLLCSFFIIEASGRRMIV